ncbi:MAG: HAD-IA family hydrolase [Lachnospiraceae bacterium]|nr:HAD-IA family hydrolase [Lachnospiraceae bacterium]
MRYPNIILDIGGVLLSYRWLGLIMETISDKTGAKAFGHRIFDDPLWLEFDIGLRPFDDIVEDYVKKYPEDEVHIRYMLGHLERMPIPRPRVWDKLKELKKAGYHLYLLSNYSSRMFHTHTDGLPFFDCLDGGVISYEVHFLKPHREIYEALFKKYDLDPSECIFFDDRQENVDGGRRCGMEGRVIYSEEVLLGYMDRLLSPDGINNRFHDPGYSHEERIDWLLSQMSAEEKIVLYSHPEMGVGRLGVEGFVLGGEATHGVEARNEQNRLGPEPDTTTSFPEPVGMSASWDPDLIMQAGRIVGTEARACWKRHRRSGLSRWAPTIDMERDPRWGRNEEGYGEDPFLTSCNALAYIRGMQGDDPYHVLCGSTLKHFYGNNNEKDRFFSNSSIGPRDKYEYYLPAFLTALAKGRALGIMTSYNKVNGIPAMLDHEVKDMLKEKYGLLHAVSDGFAMGRLNKYHHESGTPAECLSESIKAGVDMINDKPEDVEHALRGAMELSLLSEDELDTALKNILSVGMRLGIYDPDGRSPYDDISSRDLDSERAREICHKLTEESLVLLENKNDCLPLDKGRTEKIALIGPLADEWYQDWYTGIPPFRHSIRDGISSLLSADIAYSNGLDTFRITCKGKAWHINDDDTICLSEPDKGDLFYVEDWNDGNYTIRNVATGRYVQSMFYNAPEEVLGTLKADKQDVFDWFVTCRFHMEKESDDSFVIRNRFLKPVGVTDDNIVKADDSLPAKAFRLEKVSDGLDKAMDTVKNKDTVILVLGCNPMISAREDFDRKSLALPSHQQKLLDRLIATDKKVVTVMLSNYPYTMNGSEKQTDALLLSATGSQYLGDSVAAALFGDAAPAGRLVQSWPVSESILPDISDYDIIGKRTYRYISDGLMYPFGYGLSYGKIIYSGISADISGDGRSLEIILKLKNSGARTTDEVVQIYARSDIEDDRLSNAGYGRRLIAFTRVKDLDPGEEKTVTLSTELETLQIFDVVRREYILYEGKYHIYCGCNAVTELLSTDIHIDGDTFGYRDLSELTPVYYCDDCRDVEFVKGSYGMTAASALNPLSGASLVFSKCRIPDKTEKVSLILMSESCGSAEIIWNGKKIVSWNGNTSSHPKPLTVYDLPAEYSTPPVSWPAVWTETECPLEDPSVLESEGTMEIRLSGDIRLLSIKLC